MANAAETTAEKTAEKTAETSDRATARLDELVAAQGDEADELRAGLAAAGIETLTAMRRIGELRLTFRLTADGTEAAAVVLPSRPTGRAFVRTRWFDLGYLSDEGATPPRAVLNAVRQLGRALEKAAVARPALALLIDPSAQTSGRGMQALRASSPSGVDLSFMANGELLQFDVTRCSRRKDVAPREAGIAALLLQRPDGVAVFRARGAAAMGDGVHTSRMVHGRAWLRLADSWRALRLADRCRACSVRFSCAGVFNLDDGAVDRPLPSGPRDVDMAGVAAEGLAPLRTQIAAMTASGPRRAVLGGPAFGQLIGHLAPRPPDREVRDADSGSLLVVEAELLTSRDGRASLARALSDAGDELEVLVVGRAPQALVLAERSVGQIQPGAVGFELAIRPAEVARVARSLAGTRLELQDYRLAGRDGAEPWWLRYRPQGQGRPMPAVQHITMVANRRCVTVCRYCDLPLRMTASMTLREALAAIEETAVLGAEALEFFGGEVTLRQDLFAILAFASRLGVQTFVTTTGVGLDDDDLGRLVSAGIQDLSISVDAPEAAVHDDLKGREGMFAAATHAARTLKQRGATWVSFNSVITRFNYELLPGVVELAGELGLDGSTFFFCQPLAEIGNETPLMTEAEVSHLVNDILPRCREIATRVGVQLGVRPAVDLEACNPEQVAARVGSGTYCRIYETEEPCSIARRIVSIHPGGDVRLCNQPVFQFVPEPVVGNLREMHLGEVLLSDRAECFRKEAGRLPDCRFCTFDHPLPDETGGGAAG